VRPGWRPHRPGFAAGIRPRRCIRAWPALRVATRRSVVSCASGRPAASRSSCCGPSQSLVSPVSGTCRRMLRGSLAGVGPVGASWGGRVAWRRLPRAWASSLPSISTGDDGGRSATGRTEPLAAASRRWRSAGRAATRRARSRLRAPRAEAVRGRPWRRTRRPSGSNPASSSTRPVIQAQAMRPGAGRPPSPGLDGKLGDQGADRRCHQSTVATVSVERVAST
jgi:hypothetical protein